MGIEHTRHVERAMSVFDLTIWKALDLEKSLSTRVMLIYDEKTEQRDFKVLDHMMTRDLSSRIEAWLAEHVHIPTLIDSLDGDESFDADDLPAC